MNGASMASRPAPEPTSLLQRTVAFFLVRTEGLVPTVIALVVAALMVASGIVHIHLWVIAYRHVATLGPLFLVQAVSALVLAVALATTRRMIVVLSSFVLMAGTIVGFILVVTVGLFGFKLLTITNWAVAALVVETAAVALLGLDCVLAVRSDSAS